MKKSKVKSKIKLETMHVILAIVIVLVIIGIVYAVARINEVEYTTLKEDVNNSCSEDGSSTAVAQKFVEIQVPTNEVDEYLGKAAEEGRCIYRDTNTSE